MKYNIDLFLKSTWPESKQLFEKDKRIDDIYVWPVIPFKAYDIAMETFWFCQFQLNLPYNTKKVSRIKPQFLIEHEIEYYMHYAQAEGFKGEIPRQSLFVDKNVNPFWMEHYCIDKKNIVGIHAGCFGNGWEKKQWPHFLELTMLLKRDNYVVVFGKDNERIEQDGVLNETDLSLSETIKSIKECDYFISNDSGLMHIANALDVPTIALFGPSLTVKNRPIGKNTLMIVNEDLDCVPCQYKPEFNTCKDNKCLRQIPSRFVFDEFQKFKEKF